MEGRRNYLIVVHGVVDAARSLALEVVAGVRNCMWTFQHTVLLHVVVVFDGEVLSQRMEDRFWGSPKRPLLNPTP